MHFAYIVLTTSVENMSSMDTYDLSKFLPDMTPTYSLIPPDLNTSGCSLATSNSTPACMNHQKAKPWSVFRLPMNVVVILTVAYSAVMLLGLVNNSLVIAVIFKQTKMRTVTNYFLANLATADILVCIAVLPITLLENILTEWNYGELVCKTAPYLQGVAVSASVNTLAALAIERFIAIRSQNVSKVGSREAMIIIMMIWIIPSVIFTPWMFVYRETVYDVNGYDYVTCHASWQSADLYKLFTLTVVFLTCYIIPLLIVVAFYLMIGVKVWKRRVNGIRGSAAERRINKCKTKILRMLIVVITLFALSWLPLYSISLRIIFGPPLSSWESRLLKRYLTPLAQWLGASNSCINPFVYCYFSYSFRSAFMDFCRRDRTPPTAL